MRSALRRNGAPMEDLPTLAAYYDLLAAHDWHYEKSDDARVYERGLQRARRLNEIHCRASDVAYLNLHVAYSEHVLLGRVKPERPRA
jgi:hypothetical protein